MSTTTEFNKADSQKQIARFLDTAASRSSYGATSKQCWFLAKLIVDTCETEEQFELELDDWMDSNKRLSGKEASVLIGQYLQESGK
jgi:hypothetical protein